MKPQKDNSEYKILVIDDTPYRTKLCSKFTEKEKWEKPDPKKILSFIPGTIREIHIKAGDKVEEGQILLILEAMKMRNRIAAPMSGKIKAVRVKSGDIVPRKFLLIEFE